MLACKCVKHCAARTGLWLCENGSSEAAAGIRGEPDSVLGLCGRDMGAGAEYAAHAGLLFKNDANAVSI